MERGRWLAASALMPRVAVTFLRRVKTRDRVVRPAHAPIAPVPPHGCLSERIAIALLIGHDHIAADEEPALKIFPTPPFFRSPKFVLTHPSHQENSKDKS